MHPDPTLSGLYETQKQKLMKNAFLIFFCLTLYVPVSAQTAPGLAEKLDAWARQAAEKGWHGSALVASGGTILLENGYGLADREAGRRQNAETVFSVGSITKQFTAAAIVKLESQGKLQLDDPLSKYFPDAPADKAAITIHQLLTHSAGFPGALGDDYENVDAATFARLAFREPLLNPPGKTYEYSNVGYSLLGIIVEKVSGTGYEQFLREHLWLPAGMTRTGYLLPKFDKGQLAVGYRNGQRWGTALDRPWLPDGPGWHLRANGGVLSTAGDMHRWYLALANNTVLPKSATDKMFTPHIAEGPEAQSFYGYGWVVQELDGQRAIWHNGGNGVYNAFMGFEPATGVCIVVSSNSNNKISDELALQFHAILKGKDPARVGLQVEEEAAYRDNPVTDAIHRVILEKGAAYFSQNSRKVLEDAGFDFENDMQLLGVGERLEEAEKWEEGIALYETYTQLFPRIVVAWNRLGKCRQAQGDKAGARAAWEKSVSLRPNNNPASEWLKRLE